MDFNEQSYRNLVLDIFGERYIESSQKDLLPFSNRDAEIINELLSKILTEREQQVVKLHYGIDCEQISFRKIGRVVRNVGNGEAISGERVSRIEQKALRKLRHPNNNRELRLLFASSVKAEIRKLRDLPTKVENLENTIRDLQSQISERNLHFVKNVSLDTLDLSGKVHTGLGIGMIRNVHDLIKFSDEELLKLPMIGPKGVIEIKEQLAKLGLRLKESMPGADSK